MSDRIYDNDVEILKNAILKSQLKASKGANAVQLSLYYGIGQYVSKNTRSGVWGTGAVEQISQKLSVELPGLRGFSARNLKNMRQFYEEWRNVFSDSAAMAAKSENTVTDYLLTKYESAAVAANLDMREFLSVGFSHHMEILSKTEKVEERIFYIHQTSCYAAN